KLLVKNESPRIRRSAIKGIANLGKPGSADVIVPFLNDPETSIQLEAINAIEKLGAVDQSDSLVQLMNSPDSSVAEAAWHAFASLLQKMSEAQLGNFAATFLQRQQPERRISVLEQLAKNQEAQNSSDLPDTLQNLGNEQLRLRHY